jgi:hypothetical protein
MKLNGENIKIGPLDMNREESMTKGREWVKIDLVNLGVVRIFINRILSDASSDEEKNEAINRLKNKISNLLENENILLFGCAEILNLESGNALEKLRIDLNDLLEKLVQGDKEAGQKILNVFESYDSFQSEIYSKLSEKIPEFKKLFIEKIRVFSDAGKSDIDMSKVENLVNHAKFVFHENSFLKNLGGTDASNQIFINMDNLICKGINHSNDVLFHIVFHELLHSISTDWDNIILSYDSSEPKDKRSAGLRFAGFNRERDGRGFKWLDEAFTELFTVYVSGTRDFGVYSGERNILYLLSQKGKIDLILKLNELYFRHIRKKENKTTTAVEDWRNFSKEVDSVFGQRFLVKLDIFIATHGIDKAMEIIQKWEDGKPRIEDFKIEKSQMI